MNCHCFPSDHEVSPETEFIRKSGNLILRLICRKNLKKNFTLKRTVLLQVCNINNIYIFDGIFFTQIGFQSGLEQLLQSIERYDKSKAKRKKCGKSKELWIRIRTYMFLGLPDPDLSFFCTDPDPSFSFQAKKVRKTLISTIFLLLFDFLSWKTDINIPSKSNDMGNKQKALKKLIFCWHLVSHDPHL